MVRDPFAPIIPDDAVSPLDLTSPPLVTTEKKTRRRGIKIKVNGIEREVLELSKEELAQWFHKRLPIYYEILDEMVTAKDTANPVKVKLLELITKITGQIVEKHEITVINPEDIARRGIEAARELEDFKIKLIPVGGLDADNA